MTPLPVRTMGRPAAALPKPSLTALLFQSAVRVVVLLWAAASLAAAASATNLALTAKISASGELNADFSPGYLVDGKIPAPASSHDIRQAWCLAQASATNATLTLEWPEAVTVSEVVYWGRTAFGDNENFSACEVYAGAENTMPVAKSTLARGPDPQRIPLAQPTETRKLILRFPTNFGGGNPGASEIAVYASHPLKTDLPLPEGWAPPPPPEQGWELIRSGALGFTRILMVQHPPLNPTHVYTYHQEALTTGGGLWLADFAEGAPRLTRFLDSPGGEILDANLHYDGRTVLFSWKRSDKESFQLYTIQVDGTNLRQLTDHASNNFNASWLPDGGIAFLSDRKPAFAYCWQTTTPILFRCAGDGSKPEQLSANYLNDFTPAVTLDGRIVYSRWEYVDRPAIPIQSLWTIHPDGTNLAGLFGNRVLSPATFMDAREIPGSSGKFLCVLTAHNGPCRGAIGMIDPKLGANSQEAITNLTPNLNIGRVNAGDGNHIRGAYCNPFPLDGSYYLVSNMGTIELRKYSGELVASLIKPKTVAEGFYNPQPARTRSREGLIRSTLPKEAQAEGQAWATLYMQDVYNGLEPAVPRGSVKRLAIVQEMEKPVGINPSLRAFGFQFPVVSAGATYAPKRVWGYATVEDDGSAHFKVPAQLPIYFLPLDAEGRAVQRMRTFTHLMPGESQGCIGCHADRNFATPRLGTTGPPRAMQRPAEELTQPDWGRSGFSYSRTVQPVWDKHCVTCHGAEEPAAQLELTGDKTDFFNVSYENLVRKGTPSEDFTIGGIGGPFKQSKYTAWIPTYNGQEANILEIAPGRWGAKASLLATVIRGGHMDKGGKPRVDLSELEKQQVYAWLDLNCPYYSSSDSNHRTLPGCRQILPPNFDQTFAEVAQRRCVSCHTQKDNQQVFSYPGCFAVRIDNAQRNRFLLAPLAKVAGGAETCGKAVFATADDPDYQKLLTAFDPLKEQLKKNPRLDMQEVTEARADTAVCPASP